ncbi:bifunctional [glutamate--ammonia ligase]-adenylyl-L-tyrosine phosphorylase/[glutamate--ammonia-ligase] adenylyltransferase [uncultured Thiodictyon sp.]|jgi:glutamate-ammonia-ligase adenylyltransferase|uniref:bifunctional [glutamate--ammonia ligase]-adenylyl-L-tyrosine phosphorylase/[glutamate--ammonia-ligase] adenylyltransferase n=1 Tax=uncultured Thiodictyon sp. TaxID=1846217 RepID=UPI0025F73611|nr:bifunctional [glutamate--ammonia ligase]-adenylyl-L-tyrosine phosphorylase/[glutamate--ammonia-ligase] adenylyltransferase [uncultured Thiodictyon sp.]
MSGLAVLSEAPDRLWQEWLAWARAQGRTDPLAADLTAVRTRVWEASEYCAQGAARYPADFAALLDCGDLGRAYAPGDLAARVAATVAAALPGHPDEPALHRALRVVRRREQTRIIWRDIGGLAGLDETLEDLSELADCCIRTALDRLQDWTRAELGMPSDAQGRPQCLLVIGMGKLGARELNLSSDIDLIFAYPTQGQVTDGPRPLDHQQFFVRLAQRLVQALNAQTADGFVFRVDTRLRPFGDSGPLVMSLDALEDYYQSQAREWERYAMIKARVLTGDPAAVAALEDLLRPFVYRRYLDFGSIESLREMKQMIAKELHRKGMDANIKLGPGGIREIEFIGQALQLVRGGRDPALQARPIRQVLALLGERDLLPASAVPHLDAAYCFLRLVENRLQAYKDKQTHLLPADDPGRLRLARAMGFPDWGAFAAVLEGHRRRVQGQFDLVFSAPQGESAGQDPDLVALWDGCLEECRAMEILAANHFSAPQAALVRLTAFREACVRKGLSSRGAQRLHQLLPLTLQVIAASEAPDLALERVLKVLEAVVRRTAYLAMLIERPMALAQLARLTGMSPWIAEQIVRQPLLLDELIDPRRLYALHRRADLEVEIEALLAPIDPDDLEQQLERLRQFAHGNILRVAAADLTGGVPLMKVSDYLTEIAEVAVGRVLSLAFAHLAERHGRPPGLGAGDTGVLVLGYGKLGGLELGYGSDLDLVLLHGGDQPGADTDGPKPTSAEQFYNRLGQRLIHMITARTPAGILYEVDMRLRPDGNKGMLVRSLTAYADYQATAAWTWEHQALIRARPVAGDPGLAARFAAVRRATICRPRDPAQLREDVRAMRQRMRESLDKGGRGRFDLKQGRGGIADIEFMVQYSVLRWAAAHPALADWTDNIRQLETLARLDLLPGATAADLTAAYKALRGAYHRSALQDQPKTVPDDQLLAEREHVSGLWRELMGD